MSIRGIVFDKDGTLIDFDATWAAVARKMAMEAASGDRARADFLLEQSGLDLATGKFRADSIFAAGTNAEVVELWHPELKGEALARRVAEYDVITAREGAASAVAIPGVIAALNELHASGHILALATNDSTAGGTQTLAALGVAEMFAAAYGYDSVARPKPHPDVLMAFSDKSGIPLKELAMVGDNRHDLETGRAAGVGLVVGVLSGTGTLEKLEPLADIVLASVADLPDALAERH